MPTPWEVAAEEAGHTAMYTAPALRRLGHQGLVRKKETSTRALHGCLVTVAVTGADREDKAGKDQSSNCRRSCRSREARRSLVIKYSQETSSMPGTKSQDSNLCNFNLLAIC